MNHLSKKENNLFYLSHCIPLAELKVGETYSVYCFCGQCALYATKVVFLEIVDSVIRLRSLESGGVITLGKNLYGDLSAIRYCEVD